MANNASEPILSHDQVQRMNDKAHKNMKLKKFSSILFLTILFLPSCQKPVQELRVESIEFTNIPSRGIKLEEGDSFELKYRITPESLQETAEIKWSSDDKSIASVRKGKISGVSVGTTVIRAACEGGAEASIQVQVMPLEVTEFTIPSALTVPRDESIQVPVTGLVPEHATAASIDWSIADESIAEWEISAGSLYVTGLKNGTTTLTGEGSGVTRTCNITVEYVAVTGVSVTAAKSSVEIGEESSVSVNISPSGASNTNLSWEASPAGVIEFDPQSLKFTGIAVGTATIKATAIKDKVSGSCTVTVTEPKLKVSSANPPADQFLCPDYSFTHLQKTVQLNATMGGNPAEGITWSSSNEDVATVDKNGLVTAKGHGVCYIYAQSVTQKCSIDIWSASKTGYNLTLTCSTPQYASADCYAIQTDEEVAPDQYMYASFFDPAMFLTVDGETKNQYQLMFPYFWSQGDMDIITASASGTGVSITEDKADKVEFHSAGNGPATGSITFTYRPTGYTKTVNFNVGYKSVSFFKKEYGESLYRTVQSGESITLSKSVQTSWYVYLNASASYQKNVKGGLPKSISSGDSKLMTCGSNQSLYVDQYGRLSISTITIGTYTLKAAKDKTCTVTLNITN
ncbi:MAG: Ig-like domain-containing protein [Rikenellaceae bacterium]|nr:Ig-like domain-containing protein [Rikenellaceae bacterium]